jgi:hypothetical protein
MAARWPIVRDVCEGTLALRNERYLHRNPAELVDEYELRRKRAVLFNAFDRTWNALVGMVFRKDPKASDVPAALEPILADVDMQQTAWQVWANDLFASALRDGHALIYVDMPPALAPGATLADERAAGRRPYWLKYEADQIADWDTAYGKLTYLKLTEFASSRNDKNEEVVSLRYRVLRPGSWELWEKAAEKDEYQLVSEGRTGLSDIPVAVVYGRKMGFMRSRPPLLDLALLSLAHFNRYSRHTTYLDLCQPVLWFRNRENKAKKPEPIGPYTFFDVGQDGHVDFAEPRGAALEASRQDLLDLEKRMAAMGLSLLVAPNTGPDSTATGEIISDLKEKSDLAKAARSLKDALEIACYWTGRYLEQETRIKIELGADLSEMSLSPQQFTAWISAVEKGQFSVETLWDVVAKSGQLPANFDATIEAERLQRVADAANERAATMFNRGVL